MTDKSKSGCGGHDTRALPLEEALERILAAVTPVSDAEDLVIRDALGRVLASDVQAGIDVPAHTNSAMDGYALNGDDIGAHDPLALEVIGTALAGQPFDGRVGSGECVRIMTGAPLPDNADTVVMQEYVQRDENKVAINRKPNRGDNVRMAGEDIKKGAVALAAGALLEPAHIGLLASIGVARVNVLRRPRVAFFTTGDELVEVGVKPEPGQIYASNQYTLYGMLTRLGVDIVDLGIVRDRHADLEEAFRAAAKNTDAIVTSGGVSVGDADYVMEIFEGLGEISFWSVAMKPGRPTVFGKLGDALFFGLPGNPVSVMATFYQMVRPALLKLSGAQEDRPPILVTAICQSLIETRSGWREFQRGVLIRNDQGQYLVERTGHQSSGILSSMTQANCFIIIPEEETCVEPGSVVLVQPFDTFV